MKYLCIIYASHGAGEPSAAESTAIKDGCIEQDLALFAAGKLLMASPLQGPETGVSVRYRDGAAVRTDGPFSETKEWIAGFMVIEAPDLAEAISIAGDGPLEGLADFELRPLLEEKHSQSGLDRAPLFARR